MKLRIWNPLPPDDLARELAKSAEVESICEEPRSSELKTDSLDVYAVADSPAHAFVCRAALARPGVLFLESDVHSVLRDAAPDVYRRALRRAYGETGTLVGRQNAAFGGATLPALFPLTERLVSGSLAVVAGNRALADRIARAAPAKPVLHLPAPVAPVPEDAGRPSEALLVAAPGLAASPRDHDVVRRVIARLSPSRPDLRLVIADGEDPELPRHLAAADVVLALRFPFAGISRAVLAAMSLGRAVVVFAGSPEALEMPDGTLAAVDPGPHEESDLFALLGRLLADRALRDQIGARARTHVRAEHDLRKASSTLASFLAQIETRKAELRAAALQNARSNTLLDDFRDEVRRTARELGLPDLPFGIDDLLAELVRGRA